jgi:SAM-dependent methyltransferase
VKPERGTEDAPLVSIVIPFLDAGRFLEETIQSVFAQTYEHWELLLVDDGSTDDGPAIARRYAAGHPGRVQHLAHEGGANRGPSAARNLGIRHAKGMLLAFLDADDVWLPDKLSRQIALMRSHPAAGLVYGLSQWWYSWSGEPRDRDRDFVHRLGVPANAIVQPPELVWRCVVHQDAVVPNPSSILARRDVVEAVGAFEEGFRGNPYEDQAFFAKLALSAPMFAADECWDRYRQHPDSAVARAERDGQEVSQRLAFLAWLAEYLERQGWRGTPLWRSVVSQAWTFRHPRLGAVVAASGRAGQHLLGRAKSVVRRTMPAPVVQWLRTRRTGAGHVPPVGAVRFGSLRRVTPLSRTFGYDRGLPIDRHYIERFLNDHRSDVKGRVLEVVDDTYTRQFGGEHVTRADVLDVDQGNPKATIVADLAGSGGIPEAAFDCVILTQTLLLIYDVPAALSTVHRVLKPDGVLLATVPGISQISRYDMDRWGDYWRFTTRSARRLCEEAFPGAEVSVTARGNVLSAAAFLFGLAAVELNADELDHDDPDYELVITIRVVMRTAP